MSDFKDPLLEGKELSASEPELRPQEIPTEFNSIPKNVMSVMQAYLQLIWHLKPDGGKKIPFDEIIENTHFLFSPEGKYKDKLWKEHSATNLRELFYDLQFPKDYCRAIKNISIDEREPNNGLFGKIYKIKLFLDTIIHYRWSSSIKKAREMYEDESFEEKDIDLIYESVCIDLIYTLYGLFKKYVFDETK
ncbi:MAG: hypothetical protein CO156_04635 [Candidatus Pacebacteria bacterium CG_4_9_14_3_um_filter_40_12]|uniref:Uncharacterized protein n=1 Tax=Candidatus Roizmanbacteria bacterium CG_4_10_14_0_2_um_filter_39_13 TaxID=1974825 RepID=A0A2M7TYP4_9BACT|nr:MAG: hypothetical protein COY16_03150 [Candidatus Roizmanbacteria bacterium CG_4_10_14_0_2_um_filter_39_13]PJA68564.1 MAG: hypothetical protein CO156_04635 [Candidatus Pacebacteria bacterium CG_4_9_14_3_um_filter_40_12]PJC43290.1 MAG: hypothetical protein CO039_04685 [Candidatus Pacebacteria bacterium CG_4_9_14_0_2_um_filter_34_50]